MIINKIAFIEIECNCMISLLIQENLKLHIYNSSFKWTLTHNFQKTFIEPIKNRFDKLEIHKDIFDE